MEVLKLKIFDVLTERISVLEFEEWIYNSEEFMNQINVSPFCFNVISINYKSEEWAKNLNNLVKENYEEDFLIIHKIERSCLDIIASEKGEQVYQILSKLVYGFDYDTDYSILWKFYSIKEYYDLFKEGILKKCDINEEAKFYAIQVINIIKYSAKFNEIKTALTKDLKPFKEPKRRKNQSLKQKIVAFFKKI